MRRRESKGTLGLIEKIEDKRKEVERKLKERMSLHELGRGYRFSGFYEAFCYHDAVQQFKENLENEGIPSDKVKILHTHSSRLPEFSHLYSFVYRIEEEGKGNLERPLCVECGSKHVISRGDYWRCVDCGRWWTKIRRGRK